MDYNSFKTQCGKKIQTTITVDLRKWNLSIVWYQYFWWLIHKPKEITSIILFFFKFFRKKLSIFAAS